MSGGVQVENDSDWNLRENQSLTPASTGRQFPKISAKDTEGVLSLWNDIYIHCPKYHNEIIPT